MNLLRLSLRMLRRDWRAGELRVLAAALVVAVGGVTTVGFFADRVQTALNRQGAQLLGADLIVSADRPLPPAYGEEAVRRGLRITTSLKFPSMVTRGEANLLSEVKAVGPGYPLRGELRIAGGADEPARNPRQIPPPGMVWVDQKLFVRLGLAVGDFVEVGSARFKVGAVVMQEPDYGIGFVSLGPRVILNQADLPATGLVQEGSRISYRLLVAGEAGSVEAYRAWAEPRLASGEKIESIGDARPEVKAALERAGKFLGLASLVSTVLAAGAIALAARRFAERHLDGCAMMRCLGARQREILRLYLYHFALLGILASLAGCILGFAAQAVLARWLAALVTVDLPLPTALPALQGLLIGVLLLLGFAVPPLVNLRQVPTLRVLRREIGLPRGHSVAGYGLGFAVLAAVFVWKANDFTLGVYVLSGFVLAVAASALLGYALVRMLSAGRHPVTVAWRFGLASIRRRTASSVVQVAALGLGITALLVLTLIRGDLLASWRTTIPPHAPNRFLIHIQPDQLAPLRDFFAGKALSRPQVFPMVRGRLTAINGRPVSSGDYSDPRAKRLIEREFNLSWATELQPDNYVVAGRWWSHDAHDKGVLSVEEGIARTLGIALGDTLTYDVAGNVFSARVTNLRKVSWDSFRVNFFVIAPPGLLESYPVSYITSFYLPPEKSAVMNDLVKAFPNFLVIDVAAVMQQVQSIMDQVAQAVEFVFLFTLLAGLMVLYAAISATQDERVYEAAILRTLGANRRQLMAARAAEFASLGGMAGLFAAAGASALGYFLATHVLNLTYAFNPWIWPAGLVSGAIGVTLAGLWGTRFTLREPPLYTLRALG